jgi:uncharacterized protein YcbK (DUF882 family)
MSRRRFLASLATFSAACVAGPAVLLADGRSERLLSLVHTHTGERITEPYFADGSYLPTGLGRLNAFLKDFRTHEQHRIDPALFDVLHDLTLATGARTPFHVISGYRSPETNRKLHARSGGVASQSLHMVGKAIDIRLPDVRTGVLCDAALELARGGVGYYPGLDFVHVDTGRVRSW